MDIKKLLGKNMNLWWADNHNILHTKEVRELTIALLTSNAYAFKIIIIPDFILKFCSDTN